MKDAPLLVLMYGVFPLWIAAGLVDWFCHRRAAIEHTAGLKENLLHWLLFAEVGLAMVAVALLEVNAAVLLAVLAAFLLHEATVLAELHYAVSMRRVEPFEQMVHSFLELLPLASLALLCAQHWDQVQALLGPGPADFGLHWKRDPWPTSYLVGALGAVALFNVLPLVEESWRCLSSRIPPRLAPR
jgi:hypothetical protein